MTSSAFPKKSTPTSNQNPSLRQNLIYVNLSTIGPQTTGLGVYSKMVARAIANNFESRMIHNDHFAAPTRTSIPSPAYISVGQGRLGAVLRMFYRPRICLAQGDIVYCPTHHAPFTPGKTIITIHDLIALKQPLQNLPQFIYFHLLKLRIKRYLAIFTVSETSKQEIQNFYGLDSDRIFVVPNTFATPEPSVTTDVKEPYLLCVGAKLRHKNIHQLIEQSPLWAGDYRLIVVSAGGAYQRQLKKLAASKGLAGRITIKSYVSQEELESLYSGCRALVYPSAWEGFGIPPLEAMARGKPCIISDIDVHREIYGDVAIFVSLTTPDSWARAFERLRNWDGQNYEDLVRPILERFSASAAEQRVIAALKAVGCMPKL